MTFAHLLYRLIHDYPGGIAAMASDTAKGERVLGNKLNPNCDTHDTGVKRDLEILLDFANGNLAAAQYFADKANAVVVQLPEMPDMSDMALLDSFMHIMGELGQLSAEFQSSYADGVINDKEFKKISVEVDAVQARLLAFKAAVKRVKR